MTLQDAPLQLTSYTDQNVQLNIAIQMIHFIFNKTPILRNLHYGSSPNLLVNKVSKFMKTIATNSCDYSVHILYIYKFNI